MTELEMLEKLKDFDTPSITNVVATYPGSPLCLELYDPWYDNWYTKWHTNAILVQWCVR